MQIAPIAALAAAVALVAGLLLVDVGSPAGGGTFALTVAAPGHELFNGTVTVADATAYTVLLAGAKQGGFDVEATGQGSTLFVVRVGSYANDGSAGWCYAVWAHGDWVRPPHSAGIAGLQDGQAVRWDYERRGCAALAA